MKKVIFIVLLSFLNCKSTNSLIDYEVLRKGYDLIKIENDFEIKLTEFYPCNCMPSCISTKFSLLIGTTNNINLPKKISILSLSSNDENFKIGDLIKIKPTKKPYDESDRRYPAYFTKENVVNGENKMVIIGSEYKATWGIPKLTHR